MPHGLTREAIGERMAQRGPVWVRPLAEANKSKKPLRVLSVAGHMAVLEQEIAGRNRQVRIQLDKLVYADDPEKAKMKPEPKPETMFPVPSPSSPPRIFTIAESKPPEPKMPAPPPVPVIAPPPEPPPFVAARREWKGPMRWVVMHGETHRFYTPNHKWVGEIEGARQYETEAGANRASGHLRSEHGRCKGQPVAGLRMPDAYAKLDLLAKKAAEPPAPVAPPPPVVDQVSVAGLVEQEEREQIAADSPVASIEPTPPPKAPTVETREHAPMPATMSPEMATLQFALEQAMRAELLAYEMLSLRKVELARIKTEIDLFITRKKNAYR